MMTATKVKVPTLTLQQIYLKKKSAVLLRPDGVGSSPVTVAATFAKNLETLGYTVSQELFESLQRLNPGAVAAFYDKLVPDLKLARGAHRRFKPMYPNFPTQVMEASDAELYINAMMHYWGAYLQDVTGAPINVLPQYEKEERKPLDEATKLTVLKVGSLEEFDAIFTNLAAANSSLSDEDKNILRWFIDNYQQGKIKDLLPESIPQKETIAMLAAWLGMPEWFTSYVKTATDVLRLAVVLSEGDVSLAKPTKFISFPRRTRKFLLQCLENCGSRTEDMLRYKEPWKRLAHRLHPGEFAERFPGTFESLSILRNDEPFQTFNSKVEESIMLDLEVAADLLEQRPGVFARRLDHVLRLAKNDEQAIKLAGKFLEVASQVSTPVLLQVYHHFQYRQADRIRAFFPKGQVAKVQISDKPLPSLSKAVTDLLASKARSVLVERFKKMPSLGKCRVDESLRTQLVPFAQRSASKALRTISRGSKIDLPEGNCIRFFLWWKNGEGRTDIDLSACVLDKEFKPVVDIAYYNLRDLGCAHSGDITNAPNGACEFIDMPIKELSKRGRYVAMSINSYTHQPYCDLPECFAGWMMRQHPKSGEVFEPKTVVDKVDLAADSQIALPVIIDLEKRQVIWTDMALTSRMYFNNVYGNRSNISSMVKVMSDLNRPNLYDLFSMHAEARGTADGEAETTFSLHEGVTPFDTDRILSEFLA